MRFALQLSICRFCSIYSDYYDHYHCDFPDSDMVAVSNLSDASAQRILISFESIDEPFPPVIKVPVKYLSIKPVPIRILADNGSPR